MAGFFLDKRFDPPLKIAVSLFPLHPIGLEFSFIERNVAFVDRDSQSDRTHPADATAPSGTSVPKELALRYTVADRGG